MFKSLLKSLRPFWVWRHRLATLLLSLNIAANLYLWLFIYFRGRGTTGSVPLHYNVIFGVDVIGPWQRLFEKSLLGLIIIVLNYVLALLFWQKREKLLSYFLLSVSLFVQFFLILSTWSIVNL